MGARETALNALIACRTQEAWANGILKEYIQRDRLDRREAALSARLCYGVLQNRNRLDFYLTQLLTGKLKDLHPVLRDILHLGLYQLRYMDKIPQSAAVNESVAMAKKYCPKQRFAPGLCNAVLRNAIRSAQTLQEPVTLEDRYSHPGKLIKLLKGYVGAEALEPMLAANNETPDMTIQVNTCKISASELVDRLTAEGVQVSAHGWMDNCLQVTGTGDLERLPSFREGLFYVQDPAAKLSILCAELPKGKPIRLLDSCAAPGGKSFAAAIAMGGLGKIHSCDLHPHKTTLIQNGAQRLGLTGISVFQQDATQHREDWKDSMDVVIADVPCSGYGIIRKKPDIRWKAWETMQELPQLQLEILKQQANYVKPGGLLMYSTCTLVYAENEGVVQRFLAEHPAFALEPLPLPSPFPENTTGMLALVPGQYDTDGFFIARMRRSL